MSYQVLYRTYRPKTFSEVVGQEHIIKTLKNAIKNNKLAHAYLFAGPRGTGKTTIAKIFAKAVNCTGFINEPCEECDFCKSANEGKNADIIEMDAASNNSVERIREIVSEVNYAPAYSRYKVYIIDEVHMLSTAAFNALLKTLEEPPEHIIFILATTDPQKIIPTVISRCQRFNFTKLSKIEIITKMKEVLNLEKIKYDDEALKEIATLADGGMRDALSILEEVISYSDDGVYLEDVETIFGLTSTKELVELLCDATQNKKSFVVTKLRDMYKAGRDLNRLANDLLVIIKEAIFYSDKNEKSLLEKIDEEQANKIVKLVSTNKLLDDINIIEDVIKNSFTSSDLLSYLELAFLKMSNKDQEQKTKDLVQEVKKLQEDYKQAEVEKIVEEDGFDLDRTAKILVSASKDEKAKDEIVYNRLELYKYNPQHKKYYDLLSRTAFFASCKDAMIICGPREVANAINNPDTNDELYRFLYTEFGLDKVFIAFDVSIKKQLVERYKYFVQNKHDPVIIKKPIIAEEKTQEQKIRDVFGDINN